MLNGMVAVYDAMTAQGLTSRELEGNLLLPAETEGREHVDHEHG